MGGVETGVEEAAAARRGRREPTSWTMPLRLTAAGYLVLTTLYSVVTTALYVNAPALERVQRVQHAGLSEDQLRDSANLGVSLGWAVVVVLGVLALLLAAGSYLGWRWAFWADLLWLVLSSFLVLTNAVALANPEAQTMPPGAIVVSLVLAAAAFVLLLWFVLAALRYGPWAMRRPGAA
jgi:hypothetical protein